MAKALSKNAVFTLNGTDISIYITNVSIEDSSATEDVSTYSNASVRKRGTLKDGSITVDGYYETDVGATPNDPRDVIKPIIGSSVPFTWKPEGASGGQGTFGNAVVASYTETAPVAGHITWSVSLERDGDWTDQ